MFCAPSDSERAVLLRVWKISSSFLRLQTDFRCLSLSVASPERASTEAALMDMEFTPDAARLYMQVTKSSPTNKVRIQ